MKNRFKIKSQNGCNLHNAAVGREGIAKYYMGNWFNLGVEGDDMHKVVKVEFDF